MKAKEIRENMSRLIYLYQAKEALIQMRFRCVYDDAYSKEIDEDVNRVMDELESLFEIVRNRLNKAEGGEE